MKRFFNKALLFCIFFIVITACKKDTDGIRISGFTLYDGAGNMYGTIGSDDADWTFSNSLSAKELALFDFMPAGITLDSTLESATSAEVRPVPNPMAYEQRYFFSAIEKAVIKIVVVNKRMEVLHQTALKFRGSWSLALDYSDRSRFPDKSSYRVYYSLSAAGKPNFKSGYGDIRICQTWDNCF